MTPAKPVLALEDVAKRFGSVVALGNVSIEIRPNEVVGLVGENGAGKSTLMRILAGIYRPDSGRMTVNGTPVAFSGATEAAVNGIGMVFQEQSLLLNLPVGHNIYLGREKKFTRFGMIDWGRMYAAATRQLEKVGLTIDPRQRAGDLDFATRQMVELAKALTLEEDTDGNIVILLDEPTSVLEQSEIDVLFRKVRELRSRASFVFVSHRLDEVLEISDRVYVMRDGEVVSELSAEGANEAQLHQLMVGRTLRDQYYGEAKQRPYGEDVVLQAEDISVAGGYENVDIDLHKGEVIGIVGVVGSGREALTRTFAGLLPPGSGRIRVRGQAVGFASPSEAVRQGIGYIPRERRVEGLVLFLILRQFFGGAR